MKKIHLLSFFILVFLTIKAINLQTETIYFRSDNFNIDKIEKIKLNNLSNANKLYLIGHTDNDGDFAYNKILSKNRVDKVYKYLIAKGINKNNISVEYFGENKPLNSNESKKDKHDNRRVEIKFISDPLLSFEVSEQVFNVNNLGTTTITGKDGTKIYIQDNSFAEKNVTIVLKEYYNSLDILSANLSTKSNGLIIETAGMLHMEAFSSGKKIEPQKKIAIFFENNKNKNDFKFFSGTRESNLNVNWQVEPNNYSYTGNDLFKDFEIPDYKEAIVSWLTTKKETILFDWYKYFGAKKMEEVSNSGCLESKIDLELDNYGNIIKAEFIDSVIISKKDVCKAERNIIMKCNKFIEEARRKKFDKGTEIDDNEYKLSLKLIDLNKKNKNILKMVKNSTSETEKDSLLTLFNKKIELSGPVKFLTKNLGWINCDRFIRDNNTIDYVVEVPTDMNIRMIVKRYNSYFNSIRKEKGNFIFRNIPNGEEVTLICTKYENGKIVFAIEETTVSDIVFSDFNFSVISKNELKEKIEML